MKRISIFLTIVLTVGLMPIAVGAKIILVPDDSSTIQAGINGCIEGDTILVARGVYYETINFLGKNITVVSEYVFDQDIETIDSTIIDGSGTSSVVTFNSREDTTARIHGFTIRNGNSYWAGGILCDSSSPTIMQNVITENICRWGGSGISCYHAADPVIRENRISCNNAGWGGGIACDSSSPTIIENLITDNLGAFGGGGIFCVRSSPTISNNVIANNRTEMAIGGGGICCFGSYPTISGNRIARNNTASYGGGIYCQSSFIFNNLIVDNVASEDGGGICCNGAALCNNTVAYNFASGKGGGVCCMGSSPHLYNNIIVSNIDGEGIACDPSASPWIHHNDVWNNADGNFAGCPPHVGDTTWGVNRNGTACDSCHNIVQNPLFAALEGDSFFLGQIEAGQADQSPCVDAGSASAESLGLSKYTTRTDSIADIGFTDLGYHYPWLVEVGIEEEYMDRKTQNEVILQSYPNPFNLQTSISYALAEPSNVSIKIHNLLGQEIRVLVNEFQHLGIHLVIWDGRDNSGKKVPSGPYFLRLQAHPYGSVTHTGLGTHAGLGTREHIATRKLSVTR